MTLHRLQRRPLSAEARTKQLFVAFWLGAGLLTVALLVIYWPSLFFLVLVVPTGLFQMCLEEVLVRAFARGGARPLRLLAVIYALPIVILTWLWSFTEYGPAWPALLWFLLLLNALPMLAQTVVLVRQSRWL